MPDPILLDTAPLRDQRTMVDVTGPEGIHQTVADVEAAWTRWADREGLTTRRRRDDWTTDLRTSRKTIVVYVSVGKWIGDCPECNGGVAAWPCNPRGCCLDCGTIYQLSYPPVADVAAIVDLLRVRPEQERSYYCHKGETIADLQRENNVIQYADEPTGNISIATLRDLLPAAEYAKLMQKVG